MEKPIKYLRWLVIIFGLCMLLIPAAKAQNKIVKAECFVDTDPGVGKGIPITVTAADTINKTYSLNLTGLSPGYHLVIVRVKDQLGEWSTCFTQLFYINPLISPIIPPPPPYTLISAEYFWDTDPGVGKGTVIPTIVGDTVNILRTISVSGVTAGTHNLGIRFKDLSGVWGFAVFNKVNVIDSTTWTPIADFTYTAANAGNPVTFTNTSKHTKTASKYQWDINGDGITDYTTKNITYTFTQPGSYAVRMTVTNDTIPVDTSKLKMLYRFYGGSLLNSKGSFPTLTSHGSIYNVLGRLGDIQGAKCNDTCTLVSNLTGGPSGLNLNAFSLSYWFKGSNSNDVFNLSGTGQSVAAIANGQYSFNSGAANIYADNNYGGTINNGNWHHVVVSWKPDSLKSYLDGALVNSQSCTPFSLNQLNSLVLGGSTNQTKGSFDDVYIFNRVLDNNEVKKLYQDVYTSTVVKQLVIGPVAPNIITQTGSNPLCGGDSLMLTCPTTYLGKHPYWSTGDTTHLSIYVKKTGLYTCYYRDINNVPRTSQSVVVTVYPAMNIILTTNNATNGLANGSAAVSVTGGSAYFYTYHWSNGSTNAIATSLAPGSYSVTISDGKCPKIKTFTITNTVISPLTGIYRGEYFFDNIDPCPGYGHAFTINQGQNVASFNNISTTGLAQGYHTINVRVKEKNGSWSTTLINNFWVGSFTTSTVPTYPQGNIVAAEYFYDNADPGPGKGIAITGITPGQNILKTFTASTVGLNTGFHIVSVRTKDSYGFWSTTIPQSFYLNFIPPSTGPKVAFPLVAGEYFIGAKDPGVGKGTAFFVPAGDTVSIWRTINLSGLAAGNYLVSVRVKDVSGQWSFTSSQTFMIIKTACTIPNVSFTASTVNAGTPMTLTNTSTNVNGGTQYFWDINADGTVEYITANASTTFANPGTYDIRFTVKNTDTCTSVLIKQVTVGPALSSYLTLTGSTEFCRGDSAILTAPLGSHYLWNNADTTRSITVKSTGNYQCYFKNTQNNYVSSNVLYIQVDPVMNVVLTVYPATNGWSNGSAGVSVSGGNAYYYSYHWSNGPAVPIITQLAAGTYTVTISDGKCPIIKTAVIANVTNQPLTGIVKAEYFFDFKDPGPGKCPTFPITCAPSIGSFANISVTGLAVGVHQLNVRVKDNLGNWSIIAYNNFSISNPQDTVVSRSPKGKIIAGEYFFDYADPGPGKGIPIPGITSCDTLQMTVPASVTGLSTGFHLVSVRTKDSNKNWSTTMTHPFYVIQSSSPTVQQPLYPLVAGEYFIGNKDPGVGKGTAINIPATDTVNIFRTINTSNLVPGAYRLSLRVKDLNGNWSFPVSQIFYVDTASCLVPQVSFINSAANAGQAMTLTSTSGNVNGGTTYAWDIGANGSTEYTTAVATNTFATSGTYDVELTVSNGGLCTSSLIKQIVVGPALSTQITVSRPTTFCMGDSTILTAPLGSNYLWSNGKTTRAIAAKTTGHYQCSYKDTQGNSSSTNVVYVQANPQMNITLTTYNANNGMANGSAGLSVSGGNAYTYTYMWSNGAQTPIVAQLAPATYTVTISDQVCPQSKTAVISNVINQPLTGIVKAEYFFDNNDPGPNHGISFPVTAGSPTGAFANISVAGLPIGLHQLSVRVKDNLGNWSTSQVASFYVNLSNFSPVSSTKGKVIAAEYFFDNTDPNPGKATPLSISNPDTVIMQSYTISLAGLGAGTHRISIRVKDSQHQWSITQSDTFNNCNPPVKPLACADIVKCTGDTIKLITSPVSGATAYVWTGPNFYNVTGQNQQILNSRTNNSGNYFVYAESITGCFSIPDTVKVRVDSIPGNPGTIIGPHAVCTGQDSIIFQVAPVNGAIYYNWHLPQGALMLAGNNTNIISVTFAGMVRTTDTIRLTVSNSCGSSVSAPFIIT